MGLMHIPENQIEKAFIMMYTLFTTELANSVYVEFEALVDVILGRVIQVKTLHQQSSTDYTSAFWVKPLSIGVLS